MNGGIGSDGFTRVWNSPISSPAAHLDRADLGDPGLARRAAGGLQVDDAERDVAQRRTRGRRNSAARHESASAGPEPGAGPAGLVMPRR